jgi:hypothetical protein
MSKVHPIVAGVLGAVLGFCAVLFGLAIIGFGNPHDPIMSGLIVLLGLAPAGAIGGLVLGTRLAMQVRGETEGLLRNSLKALALTVVATTVIGGAVSYYMVATATPWLNPNAPNVMLQFEVRLPPAALPPASARDVKIELQTDMNRMPGEVRQIRRDGEQSVIVGEVDLAFRTAKRQLEVKVTGQPDRVFNIALTDKAPHTPALGPWQKRVDGSEFRYRAKWPGRD